MKKIKLLSILLFSVLVSFGQTTQEEYNYITKGYKVQIESGLDMKKGYSLVDLGSWKSYAEEQERECIFKGLMRTGQTKPSAIMMIYKRNDISNGVTYYICIPSPDATDIWSQTMDFIENNIKDNNLLSQAIIWGLMKLSSQEAVK